MSAFLARNAASRPAPTAPTVGAALGQALVGIVLAEVQPVFGAGGEHPVGLVGPAADQVVDQDADIGLGPVEDEALALPACQPAPR